jgi:hypothetical protein
VEPGANDVPLVIINVGADMAGPRPGNDAGSPHRDLVVQGVDSSTPGDMVPAPWSLGVAGPGVAGLLLPGYPSSLFPPINWG